MQYNQNNWQPTKTLVIGSFAYVVLGNDCRADGVITGEARVRGNYLIITP